MGYDVDFVTVPSLKELTLPLKDDAAKKALKKPEPFKDAAQIKAALLKLEGAKPGPGEAIDYVGKGFNYARLTVHADRVHVENNCGPRELLKIYDHVAAQVPNLAILDLQSGQLHSRQSLEEWWSKPL